MKLPFNLFLLNVFSASSLCAAALEKSTLDLSLEAPVINVNPGPEYADAVRPGNMVLGMHQKDVCGPPG